MSTLSGLEFIANEVYGNGMLPIDHLAGQSNKKVLCLVNKTKNDDFVHMLDICSLEKILSYCNTAPDLIEYLSFRQSTLAVESKFKLENELHLLFLYVVRDCEIGELEYDVSAIDFLEKNHKLFEQIQDHQRYLQRMDEGVRSSIVDDIFIIMAYDGGIPHMGSNTLHDYGDTEYRVRFYMPLWLNRRERIALSMNLHKALKDGETIPQSYAEQIEINDFQCFLFICYRRENETKDDYKKRRLLSGKHHFDNMVATSSYKKLMLLAIDHPLCLTTNSEDLRFELR